MEVFKILFNHIVTGTLKTISSCIKGIMSRIVVNNSSIQSTFSDARTVSV